MNTKINKCVITIAGMGTRMLPITKTVTKEMLTIIDVPTIFLQVKEAYLSGIKEIIFVVSKKNINFIKNFFTKDYKLLKELNGNKEKLNLLKEVHEIIDNMTFTYVIQKEKGTYGALWSARKYLVNETFAVMYGDDLIDSNTPVLKQLIKEHERTNDLVLGAKKYEYDKLPKFGIIEYKNENILDNICYKTNDNIAHDLIQGRFILNSNIFKLKNQLVYHGGELQLPSTLLLLNENVRVVLYEGNYFNIGSKTDLVKANIYYGLKREDTRDEIKNYLDTIKELSI